MGLQISRLVGDKGIGSRMGFVESVTSELLNQKKELLRRLFLNPVFDSSADKPGPIAGEIYDGGSGRIEKGGREEKA